MRRRVFRMVLINVLLALCGIGGSAARAQRGDTAASRDSVTRARSTPDSLFVRARRMVLEGNGGAGRALIDSVVRGSEGTPVYPDALYWRAALAATASDAERDYRRVIVEYPFARHAGEALLALAQLEMGRSERSAASDHLQRFLLQYPNDPASARAGLWLGRLLLEQNQLSRGCAVLLRTRAALSADATEVRNQVDYYANRCAGVDTVRHAPRARPMADTTSRPVATADSAKPARPAPAAPAATPESRRYTVQVAAYDAKAAAEQLTSRLTARGIDARVTGGPAPPFRVRIGRYASEAEAGRAAQELKTKGIAGFVTTTDSERAPAPDGR